MTTYSSLALYHMSLRLQEPCPPVGILEEEWWLIVDVYHGDDHSGRATPDGYSFVFHHYCQLCVGWGGGGREVIMYQ